jgi:hypothetical protein
MFEHIDMLSISIGIWQQPYLIIHNLLGSGFSGPGTLAESNRCLYVIVEAAILFKLLLTSIIDMYNVFEHIDMLSIYIW